MPKYLFVEHCEDGRAELKQQSSKPVLLVFLRWKLKSAFRMKPAGKRKKALKKRKKKKKGKKKLQG